MIFPGALPSPAGKVGLRGVCSRFVPLREGASNDVSREASGLGYEEPLADAMVAIASNALAGLLCCDVDNWLG